jgi:hypothetical protein
MCDWLNDFLKKFENDKEVKDLAKDKFFGNLTINFFDGRVVDVNKYQTRKPVVQK